MNIPKRYEEVFKLARDGKLSPRKAIRVNCAHCMGWEDVIPRVRSCSSKTCPLWAYRPYQISLESNEIDEFSGLEDEIINEGYLDTPENEKMSLDA